MSGMRVAVGDFNDPHYRQKRKELLDLLTSMGYPAAYANKAIDQVDPTLDSAAELCFHWFEENPMPSQSKQEQYAEQIKEMSAMGFSREESKRALAQASGDINKAVFYLLADKTKELKAAIREEQAEYERVTRGGPDETFSTSGDTPFDDDSRIIDELKKVDLNQPDAATENAPNTEIKALTQQIVQLQELVLTYQNKYLALKRRVNKIKGNEEEEASEPAPAPAAAPKTPAKKDATSPRPNPASALTRQNSKHNMAAAAASINSPEKPSGPAIRDLARSLSPLPRRGTESGGSPSPPAASPNRNKSSSTSSSQAPAAARAPPPAAARSGAPPARRGEEPPALVYGQPAAGKKTSGSGSAARK